MHATWERIIVLFRGVTGEEQRFSVKGSNPQVVLSRTEGEASGAGRGWGEGENSSSWLGSRGADNRLGLISPNSYPPTC